MAATGFLATDEKKLALQLDTNQLWQLTAIVPTCVAIDAVSKAFAIQRANHTGTQLLSTIADAGTAASKDTSFFVASSALGSGIVECQNQVTITVNATAVVVSYADDLVDSGVLYVVNNNNGTWTIHSTGGARSVSWIAF